ncbi:aldo/keto reductase [Nocardia sp. NPDC059240]|uniref:aldo/keto reductase n=1 Tax=Nocardia sp. NPDC059240 TaxID=3346786 RepID=UPI00368A2F35
MREHRLGDGLTVSAVGLGCMGFSQGYGAADDAESTAAIRAAVDAGITLFDTAMSYGRGHNEQLVGQALAGTDVHIATKFGIIRTEAGVGLDGKPEHVAGYCDASLQRLGRDIIDVYYLHRIDPEVPVAETIGAMAELVTAGKVRHLGISEATPAQLREAVSAHPIAAVQFEWSMLWREPEHDIIPTARELGVGIVPYSPLGRGLLTATLDSSTVATSDFRRNDPRFQGDHLTDNLTQVAALRDLATRLGITAGQLALAWLLAQGPDVVPIPGTRHASRILENATAATVDLTPEDLAELEKLVPADGWSGDRTSFAVPSTTRTT